MLRFTRNAFLLFPAQFVGILIKSFVLKILWGWFLVPLITNTPLSFMQCFGILLIITLLTESLKVIIKTQKTATEKAETKQYKSIEDLPLELEKNIEQSLAHAADSLDDAMCSAVVSPLAVLFIGWVAHLFM